MAKISQPFQIGPSQISLAGQKSSLVAWSNKGDAVRMRPAAILFDFDGVLVDTEWAIYQAWLRTFHLHGHDLPLATYTQCIGSDFITWSPKVHLEDLSGLAFDWKQLDSHRQAEILEELAGSGPMTGVVSLLERLFALGIRRAVVSSSSHDWVDSWLEKTGLAKYFELVICRGDAARIKPAPDLYLEAARRMELPPEVCLVIEDSLNGVKAGLAAQMPVWVVPNRVTRGLDFSNAQRIFPDLVAAANEF